MSSKWIGGLRPDINERTSTAMSGDVVPIVWVLRHFQRLRSSMVERATHNRQVTGSNPVGARLISCTSAGFGTVKLSGADFSRTGDSTNLLTLVSLAVFRLLTSAASYLEPVNPHSPNPAWQLCLPAPRMAIQFRFQFVYDLFASALLTEPTRCMCNKVVINTTTNPELTGLVVSSIDIVHPTQIILGNGAQPQTIYNGFFLNNALIGTEVDTTVKTSCPPLPMLPCLPAG